MNFETFSDIGQIVFADKGDLIALVDAKVDVFKQALALNAF